MLKRLAQWWRDGKVTPRPTHRLVEVPGRLAGTWTFEWRAQ